MNIELPRHVKKPGQWKRVDTPAELDAALADGWVLRLGVPSDPKPSEDLLVGYAQDVLDRDREDRATNPNELADGLPGLDEDAVAEPAKRGRGRPRKGA